MDTHMGHHMENENDNEKENESEDRKMTYVTRDREAGNVIDEFDTLKEAEEAIRKYEEEDKTDGTYAPNFYEIAEWNKGYRDIEDKASHEGIENFDHDELLDLWWYWVGMEGATDMGMQPEDVDWYWDAHPQELKETVQEMSKDFLWYHAGYFTVAEPKVASYTSEELWNKYGTTDIDIINAGNEEYVTLKD